MVTIYLLTVQETIHWLMRSEHFQFVLCQFIIQPFWRWA